MLQFDPSWRFASPGPIPEPVIDEFISFIEKIAAQSEPKQIVENFKLKFAGSGSRSSNLDWAWYDLRLRMQSAGENAPVFIEAFYRGCKLYETAGLGVPPVNLINKVLADNKAGYQIEPPNLVTTEHFLPVDVSSEAPSLDAEAQRLIRETIHTADQFLVAKKERQAVQELLWLLETISTAFVGNSDSESSVQGKYFNKIIKSLKAKREQPQTQILDWMMSLHGFLSSPIRFGQCRFSLYRMSLCSRENLHDKGSKAPCR